MSIPSSGGPASTGSLHDRTIRINERIRQAAEKSGRPASSVRLLAVTKTVAVERILEAVSLGMRDFGENRVQEAMEKRASLAPRLEGTTQHLLGQLQTNKARKAVELFDVIQSVDRPRLAETLDRIAGEMGKTQRCLIEVKISSEPSKSGVPMADAGVFIDNFRGYKNLRLEGLMTIGALNVGVDETRRLFRGLNAFFMSRLDAFGSAPVLSMGMSDDFEIAVEEGSNMVRIGRALFGERS